VVAATRVRDWAETASAKVMTEAMTTAVSVRGIIGTRKTVEESESSASGCNEGCGCDEKLTVGGRREGELRAVFSAFSALVLHSDCVLGGLNPERDEGVAAQEK
jgi:hypothetical protein